jgi:16S rRNA (guanine966-N2)-methyltransferase
MMRIVGGHFGSRRLQPVREIKLRPTSDRLRETLFDVLGSRIAGPVFIDAYAGTGAVGIEALSRGARHVFFLERHPAATELIRKNLNNLGIEIAAGRKRARNRDGQQDTDQDTRQQEDETGVAEILEMDAIRGLKHLASLGEHADLIFSDPPYAEEHRLHAALKYVAEAALLAPAGVAIGEHSSRVSLPESFGRLRRFRVLEQGDSALSFFSF